MTREEEMIEDILKHLDSESQKGVARMSVEVSENREDTQISHKCCNMYGRPANETVGLLDGYTDRSAGKSDSKLCEE